MNVLRISGNSGSGKTTLITRVLPILTDRGYTVQSVKHTHHLVEWDREGKDSYKLFHAGANPILLITPEKVHASFRHGGNPTLREILSHFQFPVDLVVLEGFRSENFPEIRILKESDHLEENERELPSAVVSRTDRGFPVPWFHIDNIEGITDFIEKNFLPARK